MVIHEGRGREEERDWQDKYPIVVGSKTTTLPPALHQYACSPSETAS